jgi:hypothetical protein
MNLSGVDFDSDNPALLVDLRVAGCNAARVDNYYQELKVWTYREDTARELAYSLEKVGFGEPTVAADGELWLVRAAY